MKTNNRINLVMIVVLMLFARISSAEVIGGYVNSEQEEYIVVFFDAVATQKILLGASLDAIKINDGAENKSGKLYVVQPSGKWAISTKAYKDKAGLVVSVPADKLDKVIYLGYDMKVRGAMGLSESELAKVAKLARSPSLAKAAEMVRPERQMELFEGVEHAARGALEAYRMNDDERAELFNSTVGWTAGRVAEDMVKGILKAADFNEDLPANLIDGREFISADEAVIKGVGVVADDDNGGGGTGFVGVVVSGWDVGMKSVDLPAPKGLNANCAGTYLYMF